MCGPRRGGAKGAAKRIPALLTFPGLFISLCVPHRNAPLAQHGSGSGRSRVESITVSGGRVLCKPSLRAPLSGHRSADHEDPMLQPGLCWSDTCIAASRFTRRARACARGPAYFSLSLAHRSTLAADEQLSALLRRNDLLSVRRGSRLRVLRRSCCCENRWDRLLGNRS